MPYTTASHLIDRLHLGLPTSPIALVAVGSVILLIVWLCYLSLREPKVSKYRLRCSRCQGFAVTVGLEHFSCLSCLHRWEGPTQKDLTKGKE